MPESAGHPEWLQSTSTERKTYQHNRSTYSQNQNSPDTRHMARDNPEVINPTFLRKYINDIYKNIKMKYEGANPVATYGLYK